MSASEKLKTLDTAATVGPWGGDGGSLRSEATEQAPYLQGYMTSEWVNDADPVLIVAFRNALPQIVAVVEAAEAGMYVTKNAHGVKISDSWLHQREPMRQALAALDKALS